MKIFYGLFLLLAFASSFVLAQTSENYPCDPIPESEIFDVIETAKNEEIKLRLEKFLESLAAKPYLQGYIINYGSLRNVAQREKIIRKIISLRNYDASRITFVRSDDKEVNLKSDLWIVPLGATLPNPKYVEYETRQTDKNSVRIIKTFAINSSGCGHNTTIIKLGKFDGFGKVSDRYFNWTLKEFIENLKLDETLKGYVLIYGTNEEIQESENKIRHSGILNNQIGEKIVFINGGSKKESLTQLWILDEKSEPPKP